MARIDRNSLEYVDFLIDFEGNDLKRAESVLEELLPYIRANQLYEKAVELARGCEDSYALEARLNLLVDSSLGQSRII